MNIDKLKDNAIDGLERVVNHLETDDGKKLVEAINLSLVSAATTLAGARGLRKICRRFGVELTFREAYGLVAAGALVLSALDPSKADRISRRLTKSETKTSSNFVVRNSANRA